MSTSVILNHKQVVLNPGVAQDYTAYTIIRPDIMDWLISENISYEEKTYAFGKRAQSDPTITTGAYDPKTPEFYKWCYSHHVIFEDEHDAVLFKLRFF